MEKTQQRLKHMKTFFQFLSEAGIRRKQRVAAATEKQSWNINFGANALNPNISQNERSASIRTARTANADVKQEQNKRTGRVMQRAKAEAEASEPLPTTGGIHAHVERLERVGQKAAGYAGQMADVEKPGFANRRFSNLAPHGNDGY